MGSSTVSCVRGVLRRFASANLTGAFVARLIHKVFVINDQVSYLFNPNPNPKLITKSVVNSCLLFRHPTINPINININSSQE